MRIAPQAHHHHEGIGMHVYLCRYLHHYSIHRKYGQVISSE
ncbi:MAG: hypothetical protein SPE88_08150 [Paludibacteraceae bacterium]|nr:hypothetical protein [Paludibacteraceae bacterium]